MEILRVRVLGHQPQPPIVGNPPLRREQHKSAPNNLARLDILKKMFPEAAFVFTLRAPWPTIQSATIDGSADHVVHTRFVNSFPNGLLLRAAASWAEAIDILGRRHDERWIAVSYEQLLAEPKDTVFRLYHRLRIDEFNTAVGAASLATPRQRDYSFLKGWSFCATGISSTSSASSCLAPIHSVIRDFRFPSEEAHTVTSCSVGRQGMAWPRIPRTSPYMAEWVPFTPTRSALSKSEASPRRQAKVRRPFASRRAAPTAGRVAACRSVLTVAPASATR